ncbi:hypothetical protein BOX15_Mlig004674g1, partial [Macrostomum lignano]
LERLAMPRPIAVSAKTPEILPSSVHSLALAISLPTLGLVALCALGCVCCWRRKRKTRARLFDRLGEEAKSARTTVRKLTHKANRAGRRLAAPKAASAPKLMRMVSTVLQQLPSEQRRQKSKQHRSARRPSYMCWQDAERRKDEQKAPEQLPHTDSWVKRSATSDAIEGTDAGLGQIQLGIRYDRRHRFLTVALLQAANLQLPPNQKPPQQVQALLQILPPQGSRHQEFNDTFQTPPAEFNSGQPNWRYAFKFVQFPGLLASWQLRVAVRLAAEDQEDGTPRSLVQQPAHLGETWLDLAKFSRLSESSSTSTQNSSSSSATAPVESPAKCADDGEKQRRRQRRQRRQRKLQQQDEAATLEQVFWQHLEPSRSCCGGF